MENREAIKISKNKHGSVTIYVDQHEASTILQYIFDPSVLKEYMLIVNLLFENQRNREKYCKADVSNKAKDVFEMRFTNNGRNDRIYCKETNSKSRNIIMVELFESKKTQHIPKKITNRINTIGGYNYEIKK